eukprot:23228-Amphidinium_carterae.1
MCIRDSSYHMLLLLNGRYAVLLRFQEIGSRRGGCNDTPRIMAMPASTTLTSGLLFGVASALGQIPRKPHCATLDPSLYHSCGQCGCRPLPRLPRLGQNATYPEAAYYNTRSKRANTESQES